MAAGCWDVKQWYVWTLVGEEEDQQGKVLILTGKCQCYGTFSSIRDPPRVERVAPARDGVEEGARLQGPRMAQTGGGEERILYLD